MIWNPPVWSNRRAGSIDEETSRHGNVGAVLIGKPTKFFLGAGILAEQGASRL